MKVKQNGMHKILRTLYVDILKKLHWVYFGTSQECHQNIRSKFVEIQFNSSVIDRCQIRVNANRLNVMF